MSQLNAKTLMLGQNADQSKNFKITVPTPEDGTLTIERANGTDVMKFLANGGVEMPSLPKSFGVTASAGYCTLPNGLILQWKQSGLITAGGVLQVIFPIRFPTACLSVLLGQNGVAANSINPVVINSFNATSCDLQNTWTGGSGSANVLAVGY